jgi:hypothetical protein
MRAGTVVPRRSFRACNVPGCPELTDHSSGKCDAHRAATQRAADEKRPSSGIRYPHSHQQLRKREARRVEDGGVLCWRCGIGIDPGTPWDLGHDDDDRTIYRGPEHAKCNRATRARQRRP